ncbi:MAG: transcriptional regulator, Crp/Fnr family [uncultured bacterium]|nr:MAG: transcriptional regulator, Crp/Fnr family [uncultured bacterium]OGH13158.1 MAG: hypothetical protein A2687_05220 [Candidatus Levybacteria bacterium RIFCSPHIGHO2_01_FULL_38_26]
MDLKIQKKIDEFFTRFKYQKYKKGEILVRADDDPPGIFYLKSGRVKEYAISKKGDELVVNMFKPISFFPMSWAINNTPNMYFFEAIIDIEVWRAPKDKVLEFIKANPDVLCDLLSRVYRGTDGMMTRMTYLMAGNAYARLITELIIHAKRFGNPLRISEKDLAASSGMTRETISREMKTLKDKGLVSFQKNTLTIKNLKELENELF